MNNNINSNKHTVIVDNTLEHVQQALNTLVEKKSMLYTLEKERSTPENWKLDVYNGINPASITITLKAVGEQQTEISAIAQNAGSGRASDSMLTELLQDFFKIFYTFLKGDAAHKSGCMGKAAMITTILVASASLLFLI